MSQKPPSRPAPPSSPGSPYLEETQEQFRQYWTRILALNSHILSVDQFVPDFQNTLREHPYAVSSVLASARAEQLDALSVEDWARALASPLAQVRLATLQAQGRLESWRQEQQRRKPSSPSSPTSSPPERR